MQWAIESQDLVKKFPRRAEAKANGAPAAKKGLRLLGKRPETSMFTAVDGVSLQIERGEIFGLLGPNGAGKTTMIRMLCTLLEPTSGAATVNGFDIVRQATQVRQNLGAVLAGERSIYWKLTGRENLAYFAALYHLPAATARQRIDELLVRMELMDRANELVEKYSTGMKQRIAISKALLARPPILLLDEPTLGLDPQAARKVRELITEFKAEGHTILLTTHYMEEADQLSDRIGIIDQGKIIALDTPSGLKNRVQQKDVIKMEIAGWNDALAAPIEQLPGVENLVARQLDSKSLFEVSLHAQNSREVMSGLISSVNQNGTRLVNMNIVKPSLEDVFISLTGKQLRD
ncbi:MAG TPA: ATP-binding cassette domain-containing protein [Levilinea sp.]|nr:ATP-binding cassette domain-containing protein [Levilinea sp.]